MRIDVSHAKGRTVAVFTVIAVFNAALLWHFHDRYWYPVDEGIYATMAERLLDGEVLHVHIQDFHPGYGDFLNAAAFRLFGVELVSLRYPLVAGAFLQSLFVFGVFRRESLPIASAAAIASVALGVVQFLNPTPHWYALYGTCALLYWLTWAPRDGWMRLVGAGAIVGTIGLFHQLLGVLVGTAVLVVALQEQSRNAEGVDRRLAQFLMLAPLMGLAAYVVRAPMIEFSGVLLFASWPMALLLRALLQTRTANRDAARVVLFIASGALVSTIPLLLYCAINGSWRETLHETVFAALSFGVRTAEAQPWYSMLSLGALYQAATFSTPGDVVNGLFWAILPVVAGINGLFTVLSREKWNGHGAALPTVAAFYALSSLFMQNAIYLFFTAGLSLAGVLWWLSPRGPAARVAGCVSALALSAIAVAFHAAQPSTRSNIEMLRGTDVLSGEWMKPLERVSLRLDRVEQFPYATVVDVINTSVPAGAPIFALPNAPEIYFLTGRQNPFNFFNTSIGIQSDAALAAVLERLRAEPPAIVTFRPQDQYNNWASRAIMEHVRRHYDRIANAGGVEIYRITGSEVAVAER